MAPYVGIYNGEGFEMNDKLRTKEIKTYFGDKPFLSDDLYNFCGQGDVSSVSERGTFHLSGVDSLLPSVMGTEVCVVTSSHSRWLH